MSTIFNERFNDRGVSSTCPSHLCATLRPLQMVKVRMGELGICTFLGAFGVHPLTLPRGGQMGRLFHRTMQIPCRWSQPCAEQCWIELLGHLLWSYWATVLVLQLFDKTVGEKGFAQTGFNRNSSLTEIPLFWNEWRASWWYMFIDPQMRLSKDTHLLCHLHRSNYF